jgi:CheY-like chemotaxis protein
MNGLEVTCKLREMERQGLISHVPIIAITAHVAKGYREICLQSRDERIYLPSHLLKTSFAKKIEKSVARQQRN